jgi:hypothetical protein
MRLVLTAAVIVDRTNSFIGFHPAFSGRIGILGTIILTRLLAVAAARP